jgi:hypothetical protein
MTSEGSDQSSASFTAECPRSVAPAARVCPECGNEASLVRPQARWKRVLIRTLPWCLMLSVVLLLAGGAASVARPQTTSNGKWVAKATNIRLSELKDKAGTSGSNRSHVLVSRFLQAMTTSSFDPPEDSMLFVSSMELPPNYGSARAGWRVGWPHVFYSHTERVNWPAAAPLGTRWLGAARTSSIRQPSGLTTVSTFWPGVVVLLAAEAALVLVLLRALLNRLARRISLERRGRSLLRYRWFAASVLLVGVQFIGFRDHSNPVLWNQGLREAVIPLQLSEVRALLENPTPDRAFAAQVLAALSPAPGQAPKPEGEPATDPDALLTVRNVPAYDYKGTGWTFDGFMTFGGASRRLFSPNAEFARLVKGSMPAVRTRFLAPASNGNFMLRLVFGGAKPVEYNVWVNAGVVGAIAFLLLLAWYAGSALRRFVIHKREARTDGTHCPSCGYDLGIGAPLIPRRADSVV